MTREDYNAFVTQYDAVLKEATPIATRMQEIEAEVAGSDWYVSRIRPGRPLYLDGADATGVEVLWYDDGGESYCLVPVEALEDPEAFYPIHRRRIEKCKRERDELFAAEKAERENAERMEYFRLKEKFDGCL